MKLYVIMTIAGRQIQQAGSLDVAGKPIPAMLFISLWRMTMEIDVVSIVGNLGFPIAAFILLFYYTTTVTKELTSTINQMREQFAELKTVIKDYHDKNEGL